MDTLTSDGWLREAPQNVRALMRRCIMLPASARPRVRALAPSPSAVGRMGPALPHLPRPIAPTAPLYAPAPRPRPPMLALVDADPSPPLRESSHPWWDDPVVIGAMLVFFPPIGLTALWASPRYPREARWVLTGAMGFFCCLGTLLGIAWLGRGG